MPTPALPLLQQTDAQIAHAFPITTVFTAAHDSNLPGKHRALALPNHLLRAVKITLIF
jgi:hypothetical protein